VTVIGPDLCWADIDATAAYALGADGIDWLRTRAGRAALVVRADGSTEVVGQAA
jgi:thiamine biosynthesis lipoprotein